MPESIQFYNHTRKLFANGEVDVTALKFQLRNATTVFNGAHATTSNLAGAEVHGSGWAEGGEAIANAAITVTDTNQATLDGDDISETATGGDIGPAAGGVIIDDSTSPATLLFFVDFDGEQTAGEGTPFNVAWHANGIARWLTPS